MKPVATTRTAAYWGLTGYVIGNLPDHGWAWLGVKLAFTVLTLVLFLRLVRREA
jgi:hypothetical protein